MKTPQGNTSASRREVDTSMRNRFEFAGSSLRDRIGSILSMDQTPRPATRANIFMGRTPTPARHLPESRRMFVPDYTSTPAPTAPRQEFRFEDLSRIVAPPIEQTFIQLDSDGELTLPAESSIAVSPPPRPSSEPLRHLSQVSLSARPASTEPVRRDVHWRVHPSAKIRKCTVPKTPSFARPTKSWLNRVNRED
ncbi:MEiotic SPindle [Caenorhabditis elegans]|uniref:MEiotic SPindle n=1 Tax=Caenorhabditis elegans TaxID=6239 RepID=Q18282_CAEEL|nr:MEiotic SPindle [Caenorhabditis elegans]CCD64004.1 MEiotic SPindle [Caenorhabditis elegans]|eukprot:NP_501453.1 MEiotic SPindle [Caenorhabditis elegans]